MADYDLSKAAQDGSGTGGIGLIIAGTVIVLVVLFAVFGGGGVPTEQDPASVAAPEATAPAADGAAPATDGAAPVITE